MTVEQTNQLISLILNSVLMMLLSALLLGVAWLRQQALLERLEKVSARYRQLTQAGLERAEPEPLAEPAAQSDPARLTAAGLKQVRDRRLRLRSQYRWSYVGMLVLHGALMTFGISLLSLALRSLLVIDTLISTGLFLFVAGSTGLIAGLSCILIDVAKGNQQVAPLPQMLGQGLRQGLKLWQKLARRPAVRNAALLMPARLPGSDRPTD